MQTIYIAGKPFSLVELPASPAPADVEIGYNDTAAANTSPFTRAEQIQYWPGGDFWDATITLPPMGRLKAAPWEAAIAEMRGRANVFLLGDPRAKHPIDPAIIRGVPIVDSSVSTNNLPMTSQLVTRGWKPNVARLLVAGDLFQIGYRLHKVLATAGSDDAGAATLSIWPSLRETPADGELVNLNKPRGLFRLATNRRTVQASITRLASLSLQCVEAR